jgi:hypothetical protein
MARPATIRTLNGRRFRRRCKLAFGPWSGGTDGRKRGPSNDHPDTMPEPKWKQFEVLVAKIQADLAGAKDIVTPNDKIMGKTGIFRQIDISIKSNVGQFQILVVIDCKDYNHPLDIKDVEAFISMAQDVQAHRAAMVAAHGYSEAARERAKAAQIEIYTVIDTGDHPWHTEVSVPALYRYATITEIGIEQTIKSRYAADAQVPVAEIELFDAEGKLLGKFLDLVHWKWNAGDLPNSESGPYGNLMIVPNPVKVADYNGVLHEMSVHAYICVKVRSYFGRLPLMKVSGLRDVSTGHTITKQIVTGPVGRELEKTWTEIENLGDLAVKPVMTFECSAMYGADPEDE